MAKREVFIEDLKMLLHAFYPRQFISALNLIHSHSEQHKIDKCHCGMLYGTAREINGRLFKSWYKEMKQRETVQ